MTSESTPFFQSIVFLQNQIVEETQKVFTDKILRWDYKQISLPFDDYKSKIFCAQCISYNTSRMNDYFLSNPYLLDKEEMHEYGEDCRIIYCTMLTLALSYYQPLLASLNIIDDCNSLLNSYPEVSQAKGLDLESLRKFRNYLIIALAVIPASTNKWLLIRVCERLDGSNTIHRSGRGETPATKARLTIYVKETSIMKQMGAPFTLQKGGIFSSNNVMIVPLFSIESTQHADTRNNRTNSFHLPVIEDYFPRMKKRPAIEMEVEESRVINDNSYEERNILLDFDREIFMNDWGIEFSPQLRKRKYSFDSIDCSQEQMQLLLNML